MCIRDRPPAGYGFRVPMILISPYARAGYTDAKVASFASILAFSEYVLGLPPLNATDASAYNYLQSFNFAQSPIPGAAMVTTSIPKVTRAWLRAHPPNLADPS